MPTCVVSHDLGKQIQLCLVSKCLLLLFIANLVVFGKQTFVVVVYRLVFVGITHANHPQMLHGIFVKKIHRESMF